MLDRRSPERWRSSSAWSSPPLALVFAFGVAALGVAVSAIAVLASLAFAASPFLFVGWLVWLLLAPGRAARCRDVAA